MLTQFKIQMSRDDVPIDRDVSKKKNFGEHELNRTLSLLGKDLWELRAKVER